MTVTQSGVEDLEPCPESPREEPRWEPQGSQARTRLCCTQQRSLPGAKLSADGPLFAENPSEVSVTQSWPTLCAPMDHQTPLPMGFSRQEHWSGLPFPLPGDLPDPGVKPASPPLQADSLPLSHLGNLRNPGGSPSSKTITKMHKDKLLHSSVCWVSWVPGCSLS